MMNKTTTRLALLSLLTASASSFATEDGLLNLSTVPLQTGNVAKPNIMILMDTSGSMTSNTTGGTRQSVGIDALTQIVTKLKYANVGLAGFKYIGGGNNTPQNSGDILQTLLDIDYKPPSGDTNRKILLDAIDGLTASGYTPLTPAAAAIGKYYSTGIDPATSLQRSDALSAAPRHASVTVPTNSNTVQKLFNTDIRYSNSMTPPASSVIEYHCQQNFMIALTDGYPKREGAYSDTLGKWTDNDVNRRTGDSDNAVSDLPDVTAAMWDLDFRPDLPGKQNIISYVIGFDTSFQSLEDAATNGHGQYYTANGASGLVTSLESAIASIQDTVASVSNVAFNSVQLKNDSGLYSATFNTLNWTGDVRAFDINSADGTINNTARWNAAAKIDSQFNNNNTDNRNIFTYNDNYAGNAQGQGVPFTLGDSNSANLAINPLAGSSIEADLTQSGITSPVGDQNNNDSMSYTEKVDLLNYIRGNQADETGNNALFRVRAHLLGDVVSSSPVFVGKPQNKWPDYSAASGLTLYGDASNLYSAFKTAQDGRTELLYFGANDGMLHAVYAGLTAANGGKEHFAYIPSAVARSDANNGLHYLANPSYNHRYYVNGKPDIADIFVGAPPTGGGAEWRTVLAAGLREGGRGIYALDITNPSAFGLSSSLNTAGDFNKALKAVLWEFTSRHNPNLGYTFAEPKIVRLNTEANKKKWGVIVGNGYNNTGEGNSGFFILFIEKGMDGEWIEGTDYLYFDTKTGRNNTVNAAAVTAGTHTAPVNGMSTATVADLDGNGTADRVYAGDLEGNVWVLDISDTTSISNWGWAYGTDSSPKPLFSAKNSDSPSTVQPITTAPTIAKHPNIRTLDSADVEDAALTNDPNILVLFGTGRYLEIADTDTAVSGDTQSFYTVWDAGDSELTRSDLVVRGLTSGTTTARKISPGSANIARGRGADYGWYYDLPNQGERVLGKAQVRHDLLFFETQTPSNTICEAGGSSMLMVVNMVSGRAAEFPVFDANGDGFINILDQGFVGMNYADGMIFSSNIIGDYQIYQQGADPDSREINMGLSLGEGQYSWFEYTNHDE